MNMSINTNLAALTALNNVDQTAQNLQTSMNRLSTGLRINTGADDPAGLIITENMKAQIAGLTQASQNTQDGINMLKTADGALAQVSSLLNNIYSVAVSSANTAVVDSSTLQADQLQIQSTVQAIDQIANTTQFGKKLLLNGTAGTMSNVTNADDVSSIYIGGTFGGATVANGPITMQQVTAAAVASVTLSNTFSSPSAIVTTPGTFVVNGYAFTSDGTESLSTMAANLNAMSQTTGVSAQIVPNGGGYSIELIQNTYGSQYNINVADASGVLSGSPTVNANGADGVYNVTVNTTEGAKTVTFTGGQGAGDSGLKLTDTNGDTILLTDAGNQNLTSATQVGQLSAQQVQFQVGAFSGQSATFSMPSVFASQLGTDAVPGQSLSTIDLTTQSGANDAMKIIQSAITQIATMRGQIGAFQSDFLQSNANSLNVATQNITASESSIADTNMASEISNYTQLQILEQSGMSILSQANQQPQQILQLIKNA